MEKPQPRPRTQPEPEGCLTAFIRIPVRIVVLVIVLPVRMIWDALKTCARAVDRTLLRPLGRALARAATLLLVRPARWLYETLLTPLGHGLAWLLTGLGRVLAWLGRALFVWPWVVLWRYAVVPLVRYAIVVPAAWLYRSVLAPVGGALWRYVLVPVARYGIAVPARWIAQALTWLFTGLGRVLAWLGRALFVWPWVALWRYVLAPVLRYGVVVLLGWLWRKVLAPAGREIADALRVCWRIAGFVSRAVGRALAWLARNLVGRPVALGYRWLRDQVWAPVRAAAAEAGRAGRAALASARATVRQARRDAWRALVGGARMNQPVEPVVASARTLGSTTEASGAAPAPEISPRKRG